MVVVSYPRRKSPGCWVRDVVGAGCALQSVAGEDTADRLDAEDLLELIDERYERFDGRSSSAAKKVDAAFKTSSAAAV